MDSKITMISIITKLIGATLLVASVSVHANSVNYFFCAKGLKSTSEEVYIVDYDQKYIYQVLYRPDAQAVKVARFRLLEILEHNIRGVLHEEYSGDYLSGNGAFAAISKSSIRKMVSLDKTKGVLMKLYTGAGDKFGACKTSTVDATDIVSLLKESGLTIKNNVLN